MLGLAELCEFCEIGVMVASSRLNPPTKYCALSTEFSIGSLLSADCTGGDGLLHDPFGQGE